MEDSKHKAGHWSFNQKIHLTDQEIGNIISSMTIIYNFAEKVINTPEAENIKSKNIIKIILSDYAKFKRAR